MLIRYSKKDQEQSLYQAKWTSKSQDDNESVLSHDPSIYFAIELELPPFAICARVKGASYI